MDRGAWWVTVHRIAKSWTWLSTHTHTHTHTSHLLEPIETHWKQTHQIHPSLSLPGFPQGSAGKESACNVGDLGSILRLGRSPAEGKGYPYQHSGLEYSMDCMSMSLSQRRQNFTLTFTFSQKLWSFFNLRIFEINSWLSIFKTK